MQRKPNLHLQVTPCGTSYPEHTAYWKQIFTQAWLTTAGKPSTEFPFKWGWEFISNWFVFEWKHGRVTACLKHDGHHVWVIFCHSQKPEFFFFSSECSFDFCHLLKFKLMIQSNAFFFTLDVSGVFQQLLKVHKESEGRGIPRQKQHDNTHTKDMVTIYRLWKEENM